MTYGGCARSRAASPLRCRISIIIARNDKTTQSWPNHPSSGADFHFYMKKRDRAQVLCSSHCCRRVRVYIKRARPMRTVGNISFFPLRGIEASAIKSEIINGRLARTCRLFTSRRCFCSRRRMRPGRQSTRSILLRRTIVMRPSLLMRQRVPCVSHTDLGFVLYASSSRRAHPVF